MTVWLPVPGNANYEVSSDGLVRTLINGKRVSAGHIMAQHTDKKGYKRVTLTSGGSRAGNLVHRMVCIAFNGHPSTPAHEVGHRNGDPSDNRAENLRWVTPKENEADKLLHGTRGLGQRNAGAKLRDSDIPDIDNLYGSGLLLREIGEMYGVCEATISMAVNRKQWAHIPKSTSAP